ncbi:MAG: tetratricopeptide repeat protein [Thermodesulfobacteriota bacterium]|nr:tetratricopeptide repeat protein [Thermodesulfobacteriota bacterium]
MTTRPYRALPAVLLAILFLWGCAPKVAVNKPVQIKKPPVKGKTVAVGVISGPAGRQLQQALTSDLTQNKALVVTDINEADLVLTGRTDMILEDTRGVDQVKTRQKIGKRKVTRPDPFVNKEFTSNEAIYETVVEPVPFILRESVLRLTYSLADKDGETFLDQAVITARFTEKYGGVNELFFQGPRLKDLPPEDKTIERLVRDLAGRLALEPAPAATTVQYVLDSGEGLFGEAGLRQGIKLAQAGQWDRAVKVWNQALKEDPGHPAPYYNLGVAYERLGGLANLEKARDMYAKAARKGDRRLYREALTRVTLTVRRLKKAKTD